LSELLTEEATSSYADLVAPFNLLFFEAHGIIPVCGDRSDGSTGAVNLGITRGWNWSVGLLETVGGKLKSLTRFSLQRLAFRWRALLLVPGIRSRWHDEFDVNGAFPMRVVKNPFPVEWTPSQPSFAALVLDLMHEREDVSSRTVFRNAFLAGSGSCEKSAWASGDQMTTRPGCPNRRHPHGG
jgi:hypothetical protein